MSEASVSKHAAHENASYPIVATDSSLGNWLLIASAVGTAAVFVRLPEQA